MKAKDVKIGGEYVAKISGKLTTVRIEREAPDRSIPGGTYRIGGWHAINTATGKPVRIKTAGKLRGPSATPVGFPYGRSLGYDENNI